MSKKSMIVKYAAGYACLLAVGMAHAVSEDSAAPVVRLGGMDAYPGISVVEKNDSNPFRLPNATATSSNVTILSPSVLLQGKKGADEYTVAYRADVGRFSGFSADNYVDQNFQGSANLNFNASASLRIAPEYKLGHDDRGALPVNNGLRNDWKSTGLVSAFKYGAEGSQGRIVLDGSYLDRQYQNNPTLTKGMNRKTTDVAASFYYRVLPKTSLFVQVGNARIAYADPVSVNYTGNEQRYMAGVTWDATAQTSGTFKIGQLQKKFDTGVRPTFKGSSWEGNVRWSPLQVARVDLTSSRKTSESLGLGNYILSSSNAADFAYDLSEQTTLHANVAKASDNFSGSGRVDNTTTYGLKGDYRIRKWLVGGVEYSDANRTSTDTNSLFKRKIFSVSLRSEL